jgi:uncharacterized protein (DUF2235 family)
MAPNRIILLSDGTGNSDAALWRTNVWRLLNFIDRAQGSQVVFYDKGVGTASSIFSIVFGRAFGIGLPQNVLTLYKTLCQNYAPDNEIFAFGFSRGAYTIRAVIEMVLTEGLVPSDVSDVAMNQKVEAAYRSYRAKRFNSVLGIERPFRFVRDALISWRRGKYRSEDNQPVAAITFVGLWDTVGAYGLPVEGIAQGFKLIWRFDLSTGDDAPRVKRVCHALSLDDDRRSFYPTLWNESAAAQAGGIPTDRISQVWFAGEHSNLGGGNPDDSLAQISLYWMMVEAMKCGLVFKENSESGFSVLEQTRRAQDYDGRIHNSRLGFGSLYRYAPRRVADFYSASAVPRIHETVFQRIRGRQRYAPIGLPEKYEVLLEDGRVVSSEAYETSARGSFRAAAQERIWDRVWLRSVLYYLTIASLAHLFLFPLFHGRLEQPDFSFLQVISWIIDSIRNFIPDAFSFWTVSYARNPGWFAISLILLVVFNRGGRYLEAKIKDEMRAIWWNATPSLNHSKSNPTLHWLRVASQRLTKPYASKAASLLALSLAVTFVVGIFGLANRLVFSLRDANGSFCGQSASVAPRQLEICRPDDMKFCKRASDGSFPSTCTAAACRGVEIQFDTRDLCAATGIAAMKYATYRFVLDKDGDWSFFGAPSSTSGMPLEAFLPHKQDGFWDTVVALLRTTVATMVYPMKRVLDRPFGWVIIRYGDTGIEENFVDPSRDAPDDRLEELFRPTRDGQLFVYLNKPVSGIWPELFRNANAGKAKIWVYRIPSR